MVPDACESVATDDQWTYWLLNEASSWQYHVWNKIDKMSNWLTPKIQSNN